MRHDVLFSKEGVSQLCELPALPWTCTALPPCCSRPQAAPNIELLCPKGLKSDCLAVGCRTQRREGALPDAAGVGFLEKLTFTLALKG